MPKRKHLNDTQWIRNIVCNHQQNNSRLIDQEDIFFSYRWEHYQLWWKNILMMKMIITVKIIFITSSKWLESTLKRNQSMNELFIKSFINDIDWRIIKEEKSWSYAWRFYHKTLRMVQESSITIQDLIWKNIIQSKKFWLRERFLMFIQRLFWVVQSEENILVCCFKDNKHIAIIILLSTNVFFEKVSVRMFLTTFWPRKANKNIFINTTNKAKDKYGLLSNAKDLHN